MDSRLDRHIARSVDFQDTQQERHLGRRRANLPRLDDREKGGNGIQAEVEDWEAADGTAIGIDGCVVVRLIRVARL